MKISLTHHRYSINNIMLLGLSNPTSVMAAKEITEAFVPAGLKKAPVGHVRRSKERNGTSTTTRPLNSSSKLPRSRKLTY